MGGGKLNLGITLSSLPICKRNLQKENKGLHSPYRNRFEYNFYTASLHYPCPWRRREGINLARPNPTKSPYQSRSQGQFRIRTERTAQLSWGGVDREMPYTFGLIEDRKAGRTREARGRRTGGAMHAVGISGTDAAASRWK